MCITWLFASLRRPAEKLCAREGLLRRLSNRGNTAFASPSANRASAQVPNPEFEGQTKTRLGNPEVRKIVDGVISTVSGDVMHFIQQLKCAQNHVLT